VFVLLLERKRERGNWLCRECRISVFFLFLFLIYYFCLVAGKIMGKRKRKEKKIKRSGLWVKEEDSIFVLLLERERERDGCVLNVCIRSQYFFSLLFMTFAWLLGK
jgi:hypothetical protein